MESKWKN